MFTCSKQYAASAYTVPVLPVMGAIHLCAVHSARGGIVVAHAPSTGLAKPLVRDSIPKFEETGEKIRDGMEFAAVAPLFRRAGPVHCRARMPVVIVRVGSRFRPVFLSLFPALRPRPSLTLGIGLRVALRIDGSTFK